MIVKFSQLVELRNREPNKKIVFAGGTFDLFHRGHVECFKQFRKLGDVLVIAVSSDARVRQRKGPTRPILSQRERLALVDSVRYVDYTLIAPKPTKNSPIPTMSIISALKPDVFVSCDKRWKPFEKDIESMGTKLEIIPRVNVTSTTHIIHRIITRHCVNAKCTHYSSKTKRDG